ncbi:hypothetical protein INT43_000900, partial [Umbelopsis isabellina]
PRVILSHVERSAAHVRDFGQNISLIWKPDSTAFIVITDKHYLLLYIILPFDSASFRLNSTQTTHGYSHGPGEGNGATTMLIRFRLAIRIDAGIACGTTSDDSLIIATSKPSAVQRVSWNPQEVNQTGTNMVSKMSWLGENAGIMSMHYNKAMNISVWISTEGRVYFVKCHKSHSKSRRGSKESVEATSPPASGAKIAERKGSVDSTKSAGDSGASHIAPIMPSFTVQSSWSGLCFHPKDAEIPKKQQATSVAVNARFSLIAIGTRGAIDSGEIYVYSAQSYTSSPVLSHILQLPPSRQWSPTANLPRSETYGKVKSISWTADGYALAAGFDGRGFAVWSVYGHLLCSSEAAEDISATAYKNSSQDIFQFQYTHIYRHVTKFWATGSTTLFLLAESSSAPDSPSTIELRTTLYTLPFAKSAVALLHSPENTRKGLLQMDDRLLLYNGGDHQESSATIDPDAVSWSQIPFPTMYISEHWPIRYASIDSEGKWIAIAGKRGFAHYSTSSGRWKMFGNQQQEQEFHVRGGMLWFRHILVAACEVPNASQGRHHVLRFYSRDTNLDNAYMLHQMSLKYPVVYMSVISSYLLVYTSNNVLSFYQLITASESVTGTFQLELVKHISMAGVVTQVARVRGVSVLGNDNGGEYSFHRY